MAANVKVTPLVPPPPPTPSIHSNGLPDPKSISVDPMPNTATNYAKFQGSVNSVLSSTLSSSLAGARSESELSLHQVLRENIATGSDRDLTRIHWPRNSIPRRVKKLSWEDEYGTTTSRDRDISTLTDPNVSVTPFTDQKHQDTLQSQASRHRENIHIGNAVYF